MVTAVSQNDRRMVQKSKGAYASGVTPRHDTRDRTMLKFFLDRGKADECDLLREVEALKKERQFAPTIRDGLRLMRDLRAGRLDALYDLFDWIPVWIESEVERRINERMTTTDSRLARLEAEIAALKTTPAQPAGPRALSVPTMTAPVDDDDGDLIVVSKAKSDGKASCENFLNSAFALIQ